MSTTSLLDDLARGQAGVFAVEPEEFAEIEAFLLEKYIKLAKFLPELILFS